MAGIDCKVRKNNRKPLRRKLFEESKLCRFCQTEMTDIELHKNEDNSCTLQHNKPRGHFHYNEDITLWCHRCNKEDAKYKLDNKIFYDYQAIRWIIQTQYKGVNGYYIVDDYVFKFEKNTLVEKILLSDFRFRLLKNYINGLVDITAEGHRVESFEVYKKRVESKISSFSLKRYYIGGGWYQIKNIN